VQTRVQRPEQEASKALALSESAVGKPPRSRMTAVEALATLLAQRAPSRGPKKESQGLRAPERNGEQPTLDRPAERPRERPAREPAATASEPSLGEQQSAQAQPAQPQPQPPLVRINIGRVELRAPAPPPALKPRPRPPLSLSEFLKKQQGGS
jgi:hypothetical protein